MAYEQALLLYYQRGQYKQNIAILGIANLSHKSLRLNHFKYVDILDHWLMSSTTTPVPSLATLFLSKATVLANLAFAPRITFQTFNFPSKLKF